MRERQDPDRKHTVHRPRAAAVFAALVLTVVGCGNGTSPEAGTPTSSALAITSATQLADAVGCIGYKPSTPTGFTGDGDCTIGGVDFHLYLFASNSDRNALVNGIFRTSGEVTYAIGDKYAIASLDEATTRTAAGEIGATVQ